MPDDYPDPYSPARSHIELAVEALNLPPTTAERLRARHEGAMILDPLTGTQRYVDGAESTASWLRSLEQREPSLLGKAPTPAKPTAPSDLSGATITSLMVASRRGDATADAELERRARHGDGTPAPAVSTTFNLTAVMGQAHAGDATAQAALAEFFSRP